MNNVMKKKRKRSRKKRSASEYKTSDTTSKKDNLNKLRMRIDSKFCLEESMGQSFEGTLSKYTNLMKGWQFRWFILNPKTGILSYFINKNERSKNPKGWTTLDSAVISPSDDDPNTFTISSACGNNYRLRAQDAKARQVWISRLRAVSLLHSATSHTHSLNEVAISMSQRNEIVKSFELVKEHLSKADKFKNLLVETIDKLPSKCSRVHYLDPDLLKLKAYSYAVVFSLNQCLSILQQHKGSKN